ncbi:MAG TPA: LXG domain-containing protein [Bacillaceae bacterium]
MKVLKVSEVYSEIDSSIKKKTAEKQQILDIRNSLNRVIDLDGLKGKTGEAIKEHFTVLHIPAILLLNQFLDTYMKKLNEIKNIIGDYENSNGLVRQDFIEQEVKTGLNKLETAAQSVIDSINRDFSRVSDIVGGSNISLAPLQFKIDRARSHAERTVSDLQKMDQSAKGKLSSSKEEINQISSFTAKIEGWSQGGIVLSKKTIGEIEKFFEETGAITKLFDSALELSIKQGDSTLMGNVADWLDKIGKLNGGVDALKGTLAASILLSKRLTFVKDGKGNFKIRAHPDWVKKNGKYASKLASTIEKVLKKGTASTAASVASYFSKFQNSPSRLLRHLVGLNPGANVQSYLKILQHQHPYMKFADAVSDEYKRLPIDVKGTAKQLTDAKSLTKIAKRIPYVGILFSVGTNAGEFVSDKNKYKSGWEKGGRAAAGIGMDIGVAGLTTGGAVIGSMICPGPGTLIGGAIGATVGIVTSILAEDKVKEAGEKAGKWVGEQVEKAKKWAGDLGDKLSGAGKFVSGLFR